MHVEHRDAGLGRCGVKAGVGEERVLHARTAEALDAVAAAAQQQQRSGIGGAEAGDVHRQRLAVAAEQRVRVRLNVQPGGLGRADELGPCLGVASGEVAPAHRAVPSHFSANRTQAVAPSGISSSLKS